MIQGLARLGLLFGVAAAVIGLVVGFLFGVEAEVFEQGDFARLERHEMADLVRGGVIQIQAFCGLGNMHWRQA